MILLCSLCKMQELTGPSGGGSTPSLHPHGKTSKLMKGFRMYLHWNLYNQFNVGSFLSNVPSILHKACLTTILLNPSLFRKYFYLVYIYIYIYIYAT
jgi:hypothetical protein